MKAEKSFNNPSTLTVDVSIRRDHGTVIVTLRHSSTRTFKLFMSKAEAKEMGLELYRLSDSGDIQDVEVPIVCIKCGEPVDNSDAYCNGCKHQPPPPYDATDYITHQPDKLDKLAEQLADNPRFLKDMGIEVKE